MWGREVLGFMGSEVCQQQGVGLALYLFSYKRKHDLTEGRRQGMRVS